jgi:hypothetical protein
MNNPNFQASTGTKPNYLVLRSRVIKKTFTACIRDLKQIIVLDVIEITPDGFRVRCCDVHGQLPAIVMKNSGDTFHDKDRLANEVCKIIAIVRLRDELDRFLPGSRFLPPTTIDGNAIAGLQAKPMTWLAEGRDFLTAYHDLHKQVVG